MKPFQEEYTAAMPWYEREDFEGLWALSHSDEPPDYEKWLKEAREVMQMHLARGRALKLVTVKRSEYQQWLGTAPNTPSMRRTYVEYLAQGRSDPPPVLAKMA